MITNAGEYRGYILMTKMTPPDKGPAIIPFSQWGTASGTFVFYETLTEFANTEQFAITRAFDQPTVYGVLFEEADNGVAYLTRL